ncbi:AMP-binding protein [Brevibacillus sp. B_LB10_24]|uniref:AMP-binding protein n=1 Tax=Brevibacillus sp. B_LB10_24 TaxID=3380645 RepID=UPI0038B7CE09
MNLRTILTKEYVDRHKTLWPNKTMIDYLSEAIRKYPDKTAIVDRKSRYTYRELGHLVDRAALGLLELGLCKGDVISFQLPNWNEFVILHLAATRIGAVSNPLVPIYREREIGYMVGMAEAKMIAIPDEFRGFRYPEMIERLRPNWPALQSVIVVGDRVPAGMHSFHSLMQEPWEERRSPAELEQITLDPNEVTEIIFTSGTTGEPKGVLHTHNTLCVSQQLMIDHLQMGADDVVFMASTFAHQTGFLYGVRMPIQMGGTGVYQDVWNPAEFLRLIEQEKITMTTAATPFLFDTTQAAERQHHDLSSLRVFSAVGAPIPRALVREASEKLPCKILSGWGQTEDGLVTLTFLTDPEEKLAQTDGYPFPGMEVRVVDANGDPCPPNVEGDLLCRGPALFVGYLKQIEYTLGQFRDDWFITGDRAVMDEDGYIRIAGRSKDIIIRGGENIPVAYVENVLHEHPDISVAQLVAIPDPRLQERACAYISMRPGKQALTLAELQHFLQQKGVTKQYWPEYLEVIEEVPRTPSGKIQKYVLRNMAKQKVSGQT